MTNEIRLMEDCPFENIKVGDTAYNSSREPFPIIDINKEKRHIKVSFTRQGLSDGWYPKNVFGYIKTLEISNWKRVLEQ